ncbi:MAG: DUF2156 domain-containing protein [Treponema sp.]|nr:DUF2156 domain-containing protein [Treponema sp.]
MNLLDFEYLENNLDTQGLYGSDTCIANLFLLQEKYNTWLKIHNNILFRYYYGDENRTGYGFPVPLKGADTMWLKSALEYIFEDARIQQRKPAFCLITREQKELLDSCLSQYFKKHISWKTNRNDCDYIYLQKDLADLSGSNYQKKRNHVSRFNRIYGSDWEFKSFPQNDIAHDILTIAQKWYEEKNGEENPVLKLELQSVELALQNVEPLKFTGGVLYIKGLPAAMTLASPISDSVLDVIYEKAVEEFEKNGVYAVLNQQFSKLCGSYLYLNREEDMGVEGLRKAKLSYKPAMILEKFYGSVE